MDSSALLAVILGELDAGRFARALTRAPVLRMSADNWLEAAMRVDDKRVSVSRDADGMLAAIQTQVIPVSQEMAVAARDANRRFGRQSGSKAKLNFGDCFARPLAHMTQEPLLLRGGDLTHTDVMPASC